MHWIITVGVEYLFWGTLILLAVGAYCWGWWATRPLQVLKGKYLRSIALGYGITPKRLESDRSLRKRLLQQITNPPGWWR